MPVMTWEKLQSRIDDGRGQGHGENYKPWLWIHRKNPSRRGNQVTGRMPVYRRGAHFLSAVEVHIALLCFYLGAADVREQFPLWPFPHPHPLEGALPTARLFPPMRGLLDIAEEAGIDHGTEVGSSDVPYVATLDLAITLMTASGPRLAGVMGKPHDQVVGTKLNERDVDRLRLQCLYLAEAGAHAVIVDQSLIGDHTAENLESFSAAAKLPSHLVHGGLQSDFCCRLVEIASDHAIDPAIARTASEFGLAASDANLLWRHGVWTRAIDIDITQQLLMNEPLALGGTRTAAALAEQLFGEVAP